MVEFLKKSESQIKDLNKKPTRQQLLNKIKMLEASSKVNLYGAYRELDKLTSSRYLGSGVIISIANLSGVTICDSFVCYDGLEQLTIDHLKEQIKKTLNLQEILKPKELTQSGAQ